MTFWRGALKAVSVALFVGVLALPTASLAKEEPLKVAKPRNYLRLPQNGVVSPLPYVWERRSGSKHLLVLGTRHLRKAKSPMFSRLQAALTRARPQLIIHEGLVPDGLARLPRDQAIQTGADLGFTAHYAREHGVEIRSGDAPLRREIASLLKTHTAGDLLVFFTAQRLIGGGQVDEKALTSQYPGFYAELVREGLPRKEEWLHWRGFLSEYQRLVGKRFSPATWHGDMLDPRKNIGGRLNAVARASAAIRDRHLIDTIRSAMRQHDRVAVVFGVWHVLAIEPVLGQAVPN